MGDFLVLGGGIGGLAAAIALRRAGCGVSVYEAAERIDPVGAGIGLAANAVQAMRALGLAGEILPRGQALDVAWLRKSDGESLHEADARAMAESIGEPVGIFAIHRAELHQVLLDAVSPEVVRLGKRAMRAEATTTGVTLHFEDGSTAQGDALVAADGIRSVVRESVAPGSPPAFSGITCWRGVTDEFPKCIANGRAQEIWGPDTIFGIVPIASDRVYWYCGGRASQPGDERFRSWRKADLVSAYAHFPVEARTLIDVTDEERIRWDDIFHLKPIRRYVRGRVALLGDAAHAMTPYLGQGACQAFEDAVVLGECVTMETDVDRAFARYESRRRHRATFLQKASMQQVRMVHIRNPLLRAARDAFLRRMPASLAENRTRQMLTVDFDVPEAG